MASLGQELKNQRESRNISIDEMASSTKIVGRYLEALEQDRFDAMPGGFFIKGILRTYARYVGLDENEILAKYREAGVFEETGRTRVADADALPEPTGKKRIAVRALAGAGILLALVAMAFLWRSRRPHAAAPPMQIATALPEVQPSSSLPAEKVEAPPAETPAPQPVKEEWKGLTMDMTFQEETWIQVYADGTLKVSGLFPAGQKARAQAEKEILLAVVGNAGGMTFLLNGKPGKMLGRSGEVLNNVRINIDNQKDFLQNREPTGPSD